MKYCYLGRRGTYENPESVIVCYREKWYVRKERTDWSFLFDEEIEKILSGSDERYYSLDDTSFDQILDSWGGSKSGYRNMDTEGKENDIGYGEE